MKVKTQNGHIKNVSKEFFNRYKNNKLQKSIYMKEKDSTYTFKIELGDHHTYMVVCKETGYCIEDDSWTSIKYLQDNPNEWEWCGDNFFNL
tara:strand:- start:4813 stop:5085 length:273 start_codon:yes stop_codon:yes gene_type:complete